MILVSNEKYGTLSKYAVVPMIRPKHNQAPADMSNQIKNDNLSTQKSINLLFRLLGRPSFLYRS